ncbi:MAG TPA: phospholipase D-like domain-containing protein [Ignavibacteriaceae bacterium]|nr:phospholipase D-like domain-containing protein [Ignavibacteriaceae bacterium]
MSHQFITNQDKLLTEVFNNILPSSKALYFLVGYFYFSGFEEIYKNVTDKNIKILVGLDVEKDLFNKVREYEIIDGINLSRGDVRRKFNDSLVAIFNDTDFFDSLPKQEAFRIFIEKIEDGSLEIRKTLHPNHSKLYLFEKKEEFAEGGEYPGTLITGSSNLSHSGLRGQHEINVVFRDEHFQEGLDLFNDLWRDAVLIVDIKIFADFDEYDSLEISDDKELVDIILKRIIQHYSIE